MYFITIDLLKIEQRHYSDQGIITLPMTPIINISFNKHSISWEIIHCCLIHRSGSAMKAMCHHQNLIDRPKYSYSKLNQASCTIFYTSKMKTFPKGTTIDKLTFNHENLFTWNLFLQFDLHMWIHFHPHFCLYKDYNYMVINYCIQTSPFLNYLLYS